MAKPKLALIPAAQGDKFYSVLPSDGVGDFDFTRGSSATRINAQGLIETVADTSSRLNYDLLNGKVVNCPHYLLEPASTNLITYSDDFSNSAWSKNNVSINTNDAVSPDGSLNASSIVGDGSTSYHWIQKGSGSGISGKTYTVSFFAKKGSLNFLQLVLDSSVFGIMHQNFDLENGVIGSSSGSATPFIKNYGNGWYRLGVTATATSSNTIIPLIALANSNTIGRFGSFGTSGNIKIYGVQVEESSYATSYIPTNGTAITRAAETANGSGDAATFNDSEGVLMAEISALANDLTFRLIALKGTSDDIRFGYRTTSNAIYVDAPNAFLVATVNDIKTFNKVAIKYGSTGTKFFINGFELGVDADDSSFSGINTLDFDATGSSNYFFGKTRELQYFDSALTDAQLETLTSWTSLQEMITSQLYTNY